MEPGKGMQISVTREDITRLAVDAIVNAANSTLLGGGGVDGAIHRAAGPSLQEQCRLIRSRQGGCATGEAVITRGGNLPARYVIHTVGPVWNGGQSNEPALLESCYRKSILLALENGIRSIAFPNISTGIYGFPKELAADIVSRFFLELRKTEARIERVFLVCFEEDNFRLYSRRFGS